MKITERDKLLLVVLVIVLVVALAIIMPGVGIMDVRAKMQDLETEMTEVNEDISAELAELRKMGISSSEDAKTVKLAINHLEKKIHDEKVEAARLANVIMPYTPGYNIEKGWLNSVRYIGSIVSTEEEDCIISYNDIEEMNKEANNETATITVDDAEYSIRYTNRSFDFSDTEETKITYEIELCIDDANEDRFGALMLYLQQATAKGSIHIVRAMYNASTKSGSIELAIMMTSNGDLLTYAQQLEEEAAEQEEEEE